MRTKQHRSLHRTAGTHFAELILPRSCGPRASQVLSGAVSLIWADIPSPSTRRTEGPRAEPLDPQRPPRNKFSPFPFSNPDRTFARPQHKAAAKVRDYRRRETKHAELVGCIRDTTKNDRPPVGRSSETQGPRMPAPDPTTEEISSEWVFVFRLGLPHKPRPPSLSLPLLLSPRSALSISSSTRRISKNGRKWRHQ